VRKAPKCSLIRTALKPTTGMEAVCVSEGESEGWEQGRACQMGCSKDSRSRRVTYIHS
jgi:hypothetical protein